jgi:ankyrin repeat protein/L-ascorbate metabolism protein UlaG (beta-lactamase superfamily)
MIERRDDLRGEVPTMKAWKLVLTLVLALIVLILFAFGGRAPAPGPESSLAPEDPPLGGATVWYLGHCGYAVRTQTHFLIFDYQEQTDGRQPKTKPERPSLASGWIDPEEIKDLKVRVFVSHSHADHFDPVIFSWKKTVPDIRYFFGWKAADDVSYSYLIGPRAEIKADGLEIATINSHHSGVPEVAWLVKVDGLVIYHNGDCLPDDPSSEHDFLRTKTDSIDLAFVFPVIEEGQKYTIQERDFFRKFRVGAAFPMHARAGDAMYLDFQKAFQASFPGLAINVPMTMGQKFVHVRGGAGGRDRDVFDALRKGDVQAVKTIVERSPGLVDARDGDGRTPLHHAAAGGNADLVGWLVSRGAKPELQDAHRKTALHLAAMSDRTAAVAALLKGGAALETRDDYLRTALILCARERGQAATGRVLIEASADVNAVDKFGDGALVLAAWRGKADLVDLLLEKGARVPASGPQWQGMLLEAASNGLIGLFRRLTGGGQDLNVADTPAGSLLRAAAAGGSAEIVGLLIDKGSDPAQHDRFGWTPLHYAARDGRTDAARKLVERAAPIDVRTLMGQTAYDVAKERAMEPVAALLAAKGADTSGIRFPVLIGDYLGQTPPAGKAELFAPGIVSSVWGLHSTAVFSPDGNEVYWAPMMTFPGEIYSRGGLLMMKRVAGRWTAPAWAPFSGPELNDDVPFFSLDGTRIYFISSRPLPGEKDGRSEGIWFADRTAAGWSEPRPLDPLVNASDMHWAFSLDKRGNLYFGGQGPDSRGLSDIYLARFSGGKYEKPLNLGEPINSVDGENTPFIAPDGSYLVFSRQYDLWASFREADGAWSQPVKLGPEVNSPSIELCPIVAADGKYLFFLSQRDGESHAYWIDIKAVERLRRSETKR